MELTKKKIGIFGYFGAWNLGDEAVVSVLIRNIRKRWPDADIHGICLDPDNAAKQHGVPAMPLRRLGKGDPGVRKMTQPDLGISLARRFLRTVVRRLSVIAPEELVFIFQSAVKLRKFDMLIVGGSGQLIDNEGGPWNHPYNHFKWSLLAKLLGVKFIFLSVGAGPIVTRLGRYFLKESLSMASYKSFRDDYSRDLASRIGVRKTMEVFPDQAFCLEPVVHDPRAVNRKAPTVLGIAPIAYCDPRHWSEHDPEKYRAYRDKLTEFARRVLTTDVRIIFFHTQVHGDDAVVDEIVGELERQLGDDARDRIAVHPVGWFTDAFDAIAGTDIVVASRFHAVIFSYVLSRPVVGISYDPKIDNVMNSVGQGANVLAIDTFSVDDVLQRFETLNRNRETARIRIESKVQEFRSQLERQYDHVLQ